jgi:hypothetical protein
VSQPVLGTPPLPGEVELKATVLARQIDPNRANDLATQTTMVTGRCDPSYPTVCIPPQPPDLDCGDIAFTNFQVNAPDPHGFDGDHDGVGCEEDAVALAWNGGYWEDVAYEAMRVTRCRRFHIGPATFAQIRVRGMT